MYRTLCYAQAMKALNAKRKREEIRAADCKGCLWMVMVIVVVVPLIEYVWG